MPSRNVIKEYAEEHFYHVYNRGVNKQIIFNDKEDYVVFLGLLKRYLGPEKSEDSRGNIYESYFDRVELNAFCLLPNHFHLLLYLAKDPSSITELMRKVSGSYTTYYNKRHKRVGHMFQGVFKASRITDQAYLQHISRYIHLNPKDYRTWAYSSLPQYLGEWHTDWVKIDRVIGETSVPEYLDFLKDYAEYKGSLDDTRHQLAS